MRRKIIILVSLIMCILTTYGVARLYYKVTAGFCLANITYDLPFEVRRDVDTADAKEIDVILSQEFHYLGKGCQSYVFASADGEYVIKFFKYQRFRPQWFLDYLTFLPGVEGYRDYKFHKRFVKLNNLFESWKIAYENLKEETGLVYVHLGTTPEWGQKITIYDKMGFCHHLKAGERQFLIQRRAKLLCTTLEEHIKCDRREQAEILLNDLVGLIIGEYQRGLADNDHALMQNTGVLDNTPIHVDVGQFVQNPQVKNANTYSQELFNKTYKFRKWLRNQDSDLCDFLEGKIEGVIEKPLSAMQYTGR